MNARARWKNWLLGMVIGATGLPAAWAIEPDLTLSQLQHTSWTRREGAPADVWTMAQSADGTLWLGGRNSGLSRFDGLRFEPFTSIDDHKPLVGGVQSLVASPDGGVWVGTYEGGAFHVLAGHVTSYDLAKQTGDDGYINRFAYDADGQLWAVNSRGPIVFRDGRWHRPTEWTWGDKNFLSDIHCDRRGTLWIASRAGVFTLARGAKAFARLDISVDQGRFAQSSDGALWYGGWPQLRQLADASGHVPGNVIGLPDDVGLGHTIADHDGGLWFVLEGDVGRIPDTRLIGPPTGKGVPKFVERMGAGQGLSGEVAQDFLEDRDGNIWVSTNGGLDRFRRPRFVAVPVPYLYDASLTPDADGRMWALSENGDLALAGRSLQTFKLPDFNGFAAHRDDAGDLWIAGFKQVGRFSPNGAFDPIPMLSNDPRFRIRSLASDPQGGLWAAVNLKPSFRWADGAWVEAGGVPGLAAAGTPNMITRDDHGRMWFVFRHQLARVDGGHATFFPVPEEIGLGVLQMVYPAGDVVWAGGMKRLGLLANGQWAAVTLASGAALNGVTGIVRSDDGDLWLNAGAGIYRVPKAEVDRVVADPHHPLAAEIFDRFDGLQGGATQLSPLPSAARSTDGRLWFSTTRNVVWIDPAHLQRNPRAPSVQVRAINVSGVRYDAVSGLRLPIGTTQLDVEYSAPGLTNADKMRFRYQLEGVDNGWRDADGRRQAFYTNLRPGAYRFHVIASNEDGVWNDVGATLSFGILPAFYQTPWFAGLCAALALLLLWALYRLRLRQVGRTLQARVDARMQERERIARELHDTLLQGTQAMVLMVGAAAKRLSDGLPAEDLLQRAASAGQETVVEARERIKQLRQDFGPAVDVAQELASQGEALSDEPGAARFELAGRLPGTGHAVAWGLLQIGREALRNAFLHARAALVRVELGEEGTELFVRVLDDGVGLSEQTRMQGSAPGHWGLQGMRERAQTMGATLLVDKRPGRGTLVEIRMPLSRLSDDAISASAWTRQAGPAFKTPSADRLA